VSRAYEKKWGLQRLKIREKGAMKHGIYVLALNRGFKNFWLTKNFYVPRAYETLNPGLPAKLYLCIIIIINYNFFNLGDVDSGEEMPQPRRLVPQFTSQQQRTYETPL
jgi:hypothetical protein